MDFQGLVYAVLTSWQVRTTLGLIALDLVLAFAAALRSGEFDGAKLAQFYRTNVIPYLLGYAGVYLVIVAWFQGESIPGMPADIPVDQALVTTAWAAIVYTLGKSIAQNARALWTLNN